MTDTDSLDDAICKHLQTRHGHPTVSDQLVKLAGGKWRRIDARIQSMRKAGRIAYTRSLSGWAHGWEVLKP